MKNAASCSEKLARSYSQFDSVSSFIEPPRTGFSKSSILQLFFQFHLSFNFLRLMVYITEGNPEKIVDAFLLKLYLLFIFRAINIF